MIDTTSTLFTGTPTVETQKNIEKTLKALQTVAKKKANDEIGVQVRLGVRSKIGTESELKEAFDFPELKSGVGGGAVSSDLAAQAAAELARRQGQKR